MGLNLATCIRATGQDEDWETPASRLFSNEVLEDSLTPDLLSLPNEILVKIMLYLPDTSIDSRGREAPRALYYLIQVTG